MRLRGRIVKPLRTSGGERALVAALISQALTDARRGSIEARDWLRIAGPAWCDLLGIDGSRLITDFPEIPRPAPSANALRCRRRYQERKARAQASTARTSVRAANGDMSKL